MACATSTSDLSDSARAECASFLEEVEHQGHCRAVGLQRLTEEETAALATALFDSPSTPQRADEVLCRETDTSTR